MGGIKPEIIECYVVQSRDGRCFSVPMEIMSMILSRFDFETCALHLPPIQIQEREAAEQIALEIDRDGSMGLQAKRVRITLEYLGDGSS